MKTKRHELIDADRTCREKPSSASRVGPLLFSNTHSTPAQARVILLYLTSRPQSGPALALSLTFRQKRLLFFHFCRLSKLNDPPSLRTRGGEEVTLSPGVTAALWRGIYCVFLLLSNLTFRRFGFWPASSKNCFIWKTKNIVVNRILA